MEKTPEELKQEADAIAAAALADKSLEDELSLNLNEESVESLKAQLAKEREEKENYKKGMLAAKKANKGTGEEGEEDEEEDTTPDVTVIATKAATDVIEKSNEKSAIHQFTEKYPALKDPTVWRKVVENYNPKAGKSSVNTVMQDLEAALILAKHYGGGKIADKEVTLNKFATLSFAGSNARGDVGTPELSESTIQMGKMMGNSTEALEKASQPGANEIQLT